LMTTLHAYSFDLLLILVGLHVVAVLAHVMLHRDEMLKAMFTGLKASPTGEAAGRMASNWRALSIVAVVVLAVYALVSFG
jgi:hypothetical protein